MSLAPRLKAVVDHNLPISDTTLKNKDIVIDQQTNQNVIQEDEHVDFQSETDIEDEPSGCVKWHSNQSNLDVEKENLNPNEVLVPNVFAGLSPLQELGKVLVNFSPRALRNKGFSNVDCTTQPSKGKRPFKKSCKPLNVSKCQTRRSGLEEVNISKKTKGLSELIIRKCHETFFLYGCLSKFLAYILMQGCLLQALLCMVHSMIMTVLMHC